MNLDEEILKDFLVEAKEGITKLEEEFVELEKDPKNVEILKSLFRTMHSLKGASGFFGFKGLESIAHFSEDILAKLRDGLLKPEPEIIDMLLRAVDQIKYIVAHLEEHKQEPVDYRVLEFIVSFSNFMERLKKRVEGKEKKNEPEEPKVEKIDLEKNAEEKPEPGSNKTEEKEEKEEKEESAGISPQLVREDKKEEKLKEKFQDIPGVVPSKELTETHVKVDVHLLDQLMNLAGELVLARNRVVQLASKFHDADLQRSVQTLSMVTSELQEAIMKTRMQPIGTVFNKFPRIVRDLSRQLGKKVNLKFEGTETELDRSIIEAIKDPLTHLVRNSIDHGIEPPEERVSLGKPEEGLLVMRAYHEGGQVVIEIEDDGRGIDVEKVKRKAIEKGLLDPREAERMSEKEILSFIFKPGFSTAEQVTQVSGRGVGMDVVKTNIEKLGGTIELNTMKGKGMTVRIKIPLTLAIVPALIVTSQGQRFAIPQVSLRELVAINREKDLLKIGNTDFYRLRGEIIPVLSLSKVLNRPHQSQEKNLVILNAGDRFFGLLVDQIYDSEEIVVKPLGRWFKNIPLYSGATIMGDGKLALILDIVGLMKMLGVALEELEKGLAEEKMLTIEETQFILIFEVGKDNFAVPLALISRLDKVKSDQITTIGGKEVLLYKGKVIPILRLENYLPISYPEYGEEVSILFFTEREKTVGIICSRIVDTLETTLEVDTTIYQQPGIIGHRIIHDRTVLFLDIFKIIEMFDPEWFIVKRKEDEIIEEPVRILLAEDSPFFQNLIKNYLTQAGFEVEVAENGKVALEKLMQNPEQYSLLITDIEMPEMDGFTLIAEVRKNPQFANLPILVQTSLAGEDIKKKVMELGANAYQVKLDREKVLNNINELLETRKQRVSHA
jgi:two-component system chemotaxis sensor kinase CheA